MTTVRTLGDASLQILRTFLVSLLHCTELIGNILHPENFGKLAIRILGVGTFLNHTHTKRSVVALPFLIFRPCHP